MFIYIYNCATGQVHTGNTNPISIGNAADVNVRIESMTPGIAGVLMLKDGQCAYYPKSEFYANGKRCNQSINIEPEKGVLIACNKGLFQILYTSNPPAAQQSIFAAYNNNDWYYYNGAQGSWSGPFTIPQLKAMAGTLPQGTWVTMSGMLNGYCSITELLAMATDSSGIPTQQQVQNTASYQPEQAHEPVSAQDAMQESVIDEYEGEHLCPVCWLRFDAGDVMSIASHPELMGDPVLGKHEMKRFFATQFNARGQALDEKGMPCLHMACPHCRHKLPPRFLEIQSLIFSIVGAPSSGKSYYLASLIHEMMHKGAPEFGIAWRDADPAGNSMLNDVSNRLFSATTLQQAYLSKTDLEGSLYEDFYRHGRMVKLPKPFIFNISKPKTTIPPKSLVFYDNAGEHFEPGRANEDSPGAMHVAVAAGIFFLFDPTTCQTFRKIITNNSDPQLQICGQLLDQQSIIMAETESRIASILNITPGEQLDTPFAVLLGKCDLWENYLSTPEGGGAPLLPATVHGKLVMENINANSDRLRSIMMKLQPSICMTAESISSNVKYFAISQLGISPDTFEDPVTGITRIGPDPTRLNPRYICAPTLWMLHQLIPGLIDER